MNIYLRTYVIQRNNIIIKIILEESLQVKIDN